jgi:PTS system mannose-specific IID component
MKDTNTAAERKITQRDLNAVFWNHQTMSFPFNYEKLQTIGFCHSMLPILKRLYGDADQETRAKAIKRHLQFYNSQQNTGALIVGIAAAIEEETAEDEKEAVVAVKTGLMGPFAGLGDSLLKFTWLPICGSIGAAFALQGNLLGPVIMFIMFNLVNVLSKYYFIHWGYEKGIDLIEQSKNTNIIQRITNAANVVGVIVLGSLVATTVKVATPLVIKLDEQAIPVQDMFDKVMPNFLTLLFTLGVYFFLKKFRGKHTVLLIFGMMLIGILLTMAGVLK